MDFENLYFNLETVFGKGSVSMPRMPDFGLDNIVEGYFLLMVSSRPKQEVVKSLVNYYLLCQKAKGRDIKLVVVLPDAETGRYDSPISTKTGRMSYDSFPENIDGAIVCCIERNVFDSIYGQTLTTVKEPAEC